MLLEVCHNIATVSDFLKTNLSYTPYPSFITLRPWILSRKILTIIFTTRPFTLFIWWYIKINMVFHYVDIIVLNQFLLFLSLVDFCCWPKVLPFVPWGYMFDAKTIFLNLIIVREKKHGIVVYKKYSNNCVYTSFLFRVIDHMYIFFGIYHFQISPHQYYW